MARQQTPITSNELKMYNELKQVKHNVKEMENQIRDVCSKVRKAIQIQLMKFC